VFIRSNKQWYSLVVIVYQHLFAIPEEFRPLMQAISAANFNIDLTAPECVDVRQQGKYVFRFLAPLLLPLSLFIQYGISLVQSRFAKRWGEPLKKRFPSFFKDLSSKSTLLDKAKFYFSRIFVQDLGMTFDRVINTILLLFDIVYIYVCEITFRIFSCYENTDGTYSMLDAPSVRCFSSEWWRSYFPISLISFFVYVISFPSIIAYVIKAAPQRREDPKFYARFSSIFNRYIPSCYYWHAVVIAKKCLLTFLILSVTRLASFSSFSSFFSSFLTHPPWKNSNPVIQVTLAQLVILISLVVHMRKWPYKFSEPNYLETFLVLLNAALLHISAFFLGDDSAGIAFGGNKEMYQIFGVFVVVLLFMGFGAFIGMSGKVVLTFFLPTKLEAIHDVKSDELSVMVGIDGLTPRRCFVHCESIESLRMDLRAMFQIQKHFQISYLQSEAGEYIPLDSVQQLYNEPTPRIRIELVKSPHFVVSP
jgi:hypothetical protein